MSPIAARLTALQEQVHRAAERAGRDPLSVALVAVSKTHPADAIREAYEAGQRDFGENYVQELVDKRLQLNDLPGIRWHFIGHLQRNKVPGVRGVHLLHSVDSVRLVEELAKKADPDGCRVLVQASLAGETQKFGVEQAAVSGIVDAAAATGGRVQVTGLMTMPPFSDDPEISRPIFQELRMLRDRLGGPERFPELSMGMTQDFEVAIEEGATLIRVGTAIFGSR